MRAAHPHLSHVQVASIGDVIVFWGVLHSAVSEFKSLCHCDVPSFLKGSPFYHRKPAYPAGFGRRRLSPLCPSSGSSKPEGCVARKVAGQEVACRREFLSDEAHAHQPGAHREFRVLGLLGLGARGFDFLCHLAKCEAKLDVAFQLSDVDAVPSAVCGGIELKKPELDRPFCKSGMKVKHVVPAAVVMLASSAVRAVAFVPDVREARHRLRFALVELGEEIRINRFAVMPVAVVVPV